jgi:hypothetical protein
MGMNHLKIDRKIIFLKTTPKELSINHKNSTDNRLNNSDHLAGLKLPVVELNNLNVCWK